MINVAKADDIWTLSFIDWKPEQETLREALCTVGNGHCGVRGAWEGHRQDSFSYPGTYIAGIYNRACFLVNSEEVIHETIVNQPNPLVLRGRVPGRKWWALDSCKLLEYTHKLDFRDGMMSRHMVFEDEEGHRFHLISKRIASLAYRHQLALQWTLISEHRSGLVEVYAGFDCSIVNQGVEKYQDLPVKHYEINEARADPEYTLSLTLHTTHSRTMIAQAQRITVQPSQSLLQTSSASYQDDYFGQTFWVHCHK